VASGGECGCDGRNQEEQKSRQVSRVKARSPVVLGYFFIVMLKLEQRVTGSTAEPRLLHIAPGRAAGNGGKAETKRMDFLA
jgi:hypothetical protein